MALTRTALTMTALSFLATTSCMSPVVMHDAAIAYDRTVSRTTTELLLLNIARSRWYHPIHFTVISSIAATFEFALEGGIATSDGSDSGRTILNLGGRASENPTVTIVPIQGEELTQRLLTPMSGDKLEFMLQRRANPAAVLRLMVEGIQVDDNGRTVFLANRPSQPEAYDEFRKRVLHIAWLWQSRKLFVNREPIDGTDRARILLANYGPEQERTVEAGWLEQQSRNLRDDQVLVDISPRFPRGDYPLQGHMELRSFKAIIAFLGRGLSEEPEYAVGKDPRSGDLGFNPASTLGIRETPRRPADAIFVVEERGHWYSIEDPPDRPRIGRWNRQAFDVLYQLFQLTVTDVSNVSTPTITIGK